MKFSEKLKTLRKQKHLTQAELAKKLGVGTTTVINWENDYSQPKSKKHYEKLAKIFNVDINEFTNENEALKTINEKWTDQVLCFLGNIFKGDELSNEEKQELIKKINEIYPQNTEK